MCGAMCFAFASSVSPESVGCKSIYERGCGDCAIEIEVGLYAVRQTPGAVKMWHSAKCDTINICSSLTAPSAISGQAIAAEANESVSAGRVEL